MYISCMYQRQADGLVPSAPPSLNYSVVLSVLVQEPTGADRSCVYLYYRWALAGGPTVRRDTLYSHGSSNLVGLHMWG